ncbi:hypothetical protein GRI89_13045 [Altererythrobacter salegens]|uniref:DUF1570 domain-containing protein n=1 Tax=Croceibacterium salegens TaxID=1737568 RepID=A0A6I4SWQ8_9SPHN|nr:hypothetical protein [Croceibacterium salegens]MXO60465.1 hypothetical protein [Croceibacterium salegens]
MRRTVALAASSCLLVVPTAPAVAQSDYEIGRTEWQEAHFPQARPPLLSHRSMRGGRTAEVDYMLETSGCRISGKREWGSRVLNYILYSYPLSRAGRQIVEHELGRCRDSSELTQPETELAMLAPGATASGKLWYSGEANPLPAYPARAVRPVDDVLSGVHRVQLDDPDAYRTVLDRTAMPGAKVRVAGRFGVVSTGGQSEQQLQEIGARLESYVDFLHDSYGLELPPTFISIYLSPTNAELTKAALELHGLQISPSTLGYAYPEDSSVSAMVGGTGIGTILHELFHLILRDQYGDMPQWLDEGIASLYEVSREENGAYLGVPNWRGALLANAGDKRPSLREVITSPWFDFDGVSGGDEVGEKGARQLALARYFALYLQPRGKLAEVFGAFRDRDPGAADDPAEEAVAIVERVAGPLARLEPDFWEWFDTIGARDDNNLPGVISKQLPPH